MRNFIANFVRILGICKDFAGNRVKFVKTQEPSAAPWDGIIVRLRPTGAIAHPKVYTTMDISSMLSAEYMVLYILTI